MLWVENLICVWRRVDFSWNKLGSKLIEGIFESIILDFNFSSSSFKFIWQFYSLVLMIMNLTDNIFKILNHFYKVSGSFRILLASLYSNSNSSLLVSVIFFILIWLNSRKLKKKLSNNQWKYKEDFGQVNNKTKVIRKKEKKVKKLYLQSQHKFERKLKM